MPINHVLIDFENVQPKNLELLTKHPFKIYVFVGANQSKVPFDLASTMQAFGQDATYIKIAGNGQNALDFHIAFHIGRLSIMDPDGYFHIISRDTGFDPLIKHLRANRIRVQRAKDLAEIPVLRMALSISSDDKIEAITKNLAGRGSSKPRKLKTLVNTINALFAKKLEESELTDLIKKLEERKFITIDQENVSYKLPKTG